MHAFSTVAACARLAAYAISVTAHGPLNWVRARWLKRGSHDARLDRYWILSRPTARRARGKRRSAATLTPLNEGVIINVVCTSKAGKQTISTTFTGDFETRYHATLKTTFDPPVGAIRNMGVKLDGKYLGPCPEGADVPGTEETAPGAGAP